MTIEHIEMVAGERFLRTLAALQCICGKIFSLTDLGNLVVLIGWNELPSLVSGLHIWSLVDLNSRPSLYLSRLLSRLVEGDSRGRRIQSH